MNCDYRQYKNFSIDKGTSPSKSDLDLLYKKQAELAGQLADVKNQIKASDASGRTYKPAGPAERYIQEPATPWHPLTFLGMLVDTAGFAYSSDTDIIFSTMYNYQRLLGYCDLYDDCAVLILSRIDCETIYFTDDTYEWRVELWKGQYGIETGCEIGFYRREKDEPVTPLEKTLKSPLYLCVPDDARQVMSLDLKWKKNDESILYRKDQKHWWLTGFRWGNFADPGDIYMNTSISFQNAGLKDLFTGALRKLGYEYSEKPGNTVSFRFDTPKTEQPLTQRTLGWIIQAVNRKSVTLYNNMKAQCGIQTNDPNEIWNKLKANDKKEVEKLLEYIESYIYNRIAVR